VADPPPRPHNLACTTGFLKTAFMLSTRSHADRYDIFMLRAASLIDPRSRIDSST
jgi:hypothetical protein